MADSARMAHAWSTAPASEMRRLKTMVEDEMMVKVGAKKDTMEFHPLILAQRAQRANTSFDLHYQRVKPPFTEKQPASRNPWSITDHALRQLSDLSRQGPRKLQLPSLPPRVVPRVSPPAVDEEFQRLRIIRLLKRDEILAEWSALQHQAFAVRKVSHLSLPDIEPLRKYSSASLFSLKSPVPPHVKAAAGEGQRRAKKTVVPFTYVPPTGKPKSRWRGMARQLLWNSKAAQMRLPEDLPRSEIRIYVSCTQDLSEEREFLDEVAYPELRKFCEKQGLSCHVVDLRHGTNRLKNDRETFDVIQREISKCQKFSIGPCFVSLVGEEADAQELPGWLHHRNMLHIRSLLVKAERVEAVEVLDNVYRLDSNYQPPIYLLEDSYFFAETQETAVLHEVLPEVLQQLRQEGKLAEDPQFYSWSSTVKEQEAGLLSCVEPKRQTVCLMSRAGSGEETDLKEVKENKRKRSVLSDVKALEEYSTPTGNACADKLRAAIVERYNQLGSKDNLILFNVSRKKSVAYLREVCTLFLSAVTRLIERQVTHHEFDITHHMTGAADVIQHVMVSRQVCSNYIGGEGLLSSVSELLSNPLFVKPIVVVGPEGAGKTALTSLIASALPRIDPLRKVVFRIVGLTLSSTSLFHLLTSLHSQVAFIYEVDPWLPDDLTLQGALQAFRDILHDIREKTLHKGPLTIVLDGVDNIPGMSPKHLSFLLGSVPQGITLVLSMLNSGPLFDTVKSITGVEVVTCLAFTSERIGAYVKAYLAKRDRVITNDQVRAILGELSEDNVPLVAKIAACMASRWPSHTLNDELDFSKDMESAFHRLVESCEVHLGYKFTRYVLALLVASRFGLAEFEILHIIATDTSLIDEIKEEEADDLSVLEGYPYQLQLSRLLTRLQPFLYEAKTEGETILKISHDMLRYVVEVRFMGDSFKHHVHSRLATFFQFTRRGNLLSSRDIVEGKYKDLTRYLWRTLRSVPYHLCHSHPDPKEAWARLKSVVFMKFSWVINEIYAGFFNDFIDDMNYALETLGLDSDILFLRQFMNGVREAVIFNPVSLASLMAGQDIKGMQELHKSVQEAEEWLKQVHLQVLVPTSYTTPKASQLQLKETLAKKVKSLAFIPIEERMILQYDTSISSLEHRTGEETALVSLSQPIVSIHLWGEAMLTVVTTSLSDRLSLDTYALEKGRHIKTTKLPDKPVPWLYVRPDGVAFYASRCSVKKVLVEKGQVSEEFETQEEIVDACMSNQRPFKLVALHTSPEPHLSVFDSRHPGNRRPVSLQGATISQRYKPLDMTKDSQFVVVVCDRHLLVVNLNADRVVHSMDFNNVPVSLTLFSRSHEHVFVVTLTGVILCFKLDTGTKVMDTTIRNKQKPQQLAVPSASGDRNSVSPGRARATTKVSRKKDEQKEEEVVSTMVTSEDDHFLLCGTSQGRVYIVHVPTGKPVSAVNTGQAGVKDVVYFTNMSWFQSVATVDVSGWVKLWNLTPLLLRARTVIKDIITDKDLLNEEEAKMDLALYCQHFQARRNDRVFLNGPDVSSFYQRQLSESLFSSVDSLDPALQTPLSWVASNRLGDCTRVCALSTGTDLSEVLVTVTREGDVARWSLQDGSLHSLQPCPCPLEEEEGEEEEGRRVEAVRTVYYDQAIFVVVRPSADSQKNSSVAVQYSAEGKKTRSLVLNDVIASYVSTNSSWIVHVLSGEQGELLVVYWDLVEGKEEDRVVLSQDKGVSKLASTLTFSNDLSACALLVPTKGKKKEDNDYTLMVWTLTSKAEEEEEGKQEEGKASEDIKDEDVFSHPSGKHESASDDGSGRAGSATTAETREFSLRQLPLQIKPTAFGFGGLNDVILLGTSPGVTLIVSMQTLSLTSAMTAEGIEPAANQSLSSAGHWTHFPAAHPGAVRGVRCAGESRVVTTTCSKVLCIWNLLQKRLVVRVPLEGDELVHHVLSRDCRVLTYATLGGVLAVWGVQEKKQLCAFKSPVPVRSLAMTPDCRRVAVLLDDEVTSRVQVFDVRNIDDIRVEGGSQSEAERGSSADSRARSLDDDMID